MAGGVVHPYQRYIIDLKPFFFWLALSLTIKISVHLQLQVNRENLEHSTGIGEETNLWI